MMEKTNFFTDDWKKIPQNLRFLFLAGAFLIFNSWLLDHWGNNTVYKVFGVDVREPGYDIGFVLIIVCFIALVTKQFLYFGTIAYFRRRYSIEKLNETFYLGWFKGKLILFDIKRELYYHVYPWETAQDLLFVERGWKLQVDFKENEKYCIDEKTFLETKGYKNGGSINTQK